MIIFTNKLRKLVQELNLYKNFNPNLTVKTYHASGFTYRSSIADFNDIKINYPPYITLVVIKGEQLGIFYNNKIFLNKGNLGLVKLNLNYLQNEGFIDNPKLNSLRFRYRTVIISPLEMQAKVTIRELQNLLSMIDITEMALELRDEHF